MPPDKVDRFDREVAAERDSLSLANNTSSMDVVEGSTSLSRTKRTNRSLVMSQETTSLWVAPSTSWQPILRILSPILILPSLSAAPPSAILEMKKQEVSSPDFAPRIENPKPFESRIKVVWKIMDFLLSPFEISISGRATSGWRLDVVRRSTDLAADKVTDDVLVPLGEGTTGGILVLLTAAGRREDSFMDDALLLLKTSPLLLTGEVLLGEGCCWNPLLVDPTGDENCRLTVCCWCKWLLLVLLVGKDCCCWSCWCTCPDSMNSCLDDEDVNTEYCEAGGTEVLLTWPTCCCCGIIMRDATDGAGVVQMIGTSRSMWATNRLPHDLRIFTAV